VPETVTSTPPRVQRTPATDLSAFREAEQAELDAQIAELHDQSTRAKVAAKESEDAARAHAFNFLVAEGIVGSLVEAAIRFALSKPEISTAMIGTASLDQFEQAVAAANRGPLPAAALERLTRIHPGPA